MRITSNSPKSFLKLFKLWLYNPKGKYYLCNLIELSGVIFKKILLLI